LATEQSSHYLHVAAIQMLPATDKPEANIQRATKLVRRAVFGHGAEVVVLPECTLTGYSQPDKEGHSLTETRAIAETVPGPSAEHFA
jgi:predicted amidohydrolase